RSFLQRMIKVCLNILLTYPLTNNTLIEVIELLRNVHYIIVCTVKLQIIEYLLIGYRCQMAGSCRLVFNSQFNNTGDTHCQRNTGGGIRHPPQSTNFSDGRVFSLVGSADNVILQGFEIGCWNRETRFGSMFTQFLLE